MAGKRYCYDHPRPMVTADCALFRLNTDRIELLLVKRARPPFRGAWVLPGGFVGMAEAPEAAAVREVGEETGLKDIPFLVQIGAYGHPDRDPRGRVITVAYAGIASLRKSTAKAGDDAAEASWFSIEALPSPLGFDHAEIIGDALRKLATLGRTSGALFVFLDDRFTRGQVGALLKALYGIDLDPDEYINTFLEMGLVRKDRTPGKYRFLTTSPRVPRASKGVGRRPSGRKR